MDHPDITALVDTTIGCKTPTYYFKVDLLSSKFIAHAIWTDMYCDVDGAWLNYIYPKLLNTRFIFFSVISFKFKVTFSSMWYTVYSQWTVVYTMRKQWNPMHSAWRCRSRMAVDRHVHVYSSVYFEYLYLFLWIYSQTQDKLCSLYLLWTTHFRTALTLFSSQSKEKRFMSVKIASWTHTTATFYHNTAQNYV